MNRSESISKAERLLRPPEERAEKLHRHPNQLAKDAADALGTTNPLVQTLYGDGLSSGPAVGVPNRLAHRPGAARARSSSRGPEEAARSAPASLAGRGGGSQAGDPLHGTTTHVRSLQVFRPPSFDEGSLRKTFAAASGGATSGALPARRRTPPAKLEPLAPAEATGDAAAPAARSRIPQFRKIVSNAPNEFTYLVMRPRGVQDPYDPYDLQVVAHQDLRSDTYYTVSASGVTKFAGGEAEFIELTTWERESRLFEQLRQLSVFRDYKRWRSFLLWRNLVRQNAIHSSRDFLAKNLFHIHLNLGGALHAVHRLCVDYSNAHQLYAPPTETRSLEAYRASGRRHLEEEVAALRRLNDRVSHIVEGACKTAMAAAQLERDRIAAAHADPGRRKKRLVEARDQSAAQQTSYIEMTQRRATCQRLTAFIKLCDYFMVTCLTSLAFKAVTDVRADVQFPRPQRSAEEVERLLDSSQRVPVGSRRKGGGAAEEAPAERETLLRLDILFNAQSLKVEASPSQAQVSEAVEDLIADFVWAVGAVPRLMAREVFRTYTEGAVESSADRMDSGPNVAEMVTSEAVYTEGMSDIKRSIARAFTEAKAYTKTFTVFQDMYNKNNTLRGDAILEQTQSMEYFRDHLALYKSQAESIASKIPDHKNVALFTIYTEDLREFFAPSPQACLEEFHRAMPIIAHGVNEKLLATLQEHSTYLGAAPRTVEHYVEYLEYYKKLEAGFDTTAAAYDFTRELFALMMEENIAVPDEDEETYRSGTRPQFEKLRTLMQLTEDSRESQQRLFTRNIDEQMDELRRKIEGLYDRAGQPIVMSGEADVAEAIEYITTLQEEAAALDAREKELRRFQLAIGAEETTVDTMGDMLHDVNLKARLWVGIRDWDVYAAEMGAVPFVELDISAVQDTVLKYGTMIKQVSTKCASNAALPRLRAKVEEWRVMLPILQALSNPRMKQEHHAKVAAVVGKVYDTNGVGKLLTEWSNQYTIQMLLDGDVLKKSDDILAISVAATEEGKLQTLIDRVNAMWNGGGPKPAVEFQYNNHKDAKNVYTLVGTSVDDTQALLDDSMIIISTVGSSKHCQGVLRAQVDRWENRLQYMQSTLEKWVELQRNWIYLENIFASSDIRSQWKDDAKRFEKVNRFFVDLMRKAHDLPTAYRAVLINAPSFDAGVPKDQKSLLADLNSNIAELERVLSSLEKKLEEKRCAFPRFYFLGNDDLLDILAKVRTPELMMPHMLKMFDGIKTLEFSDSNDITHLVSMEGERIELFNKTVKARGAVESWMDLLEREMFSTLRRLADNCLTDYEAREDRVAWMFQHPVQLVLMMEQLLWTRSVEEALDKPNSDTLMSELKDANYRNLETLANLTSQKLSKVQRILLSTMITIDVHGRDLVDEMCEHHVVESKEFGWTKQLRVYWEKDEDGTGTLFIRQNNSRFIYGYEYIGAQGRLVITPLTDRIYMTVTGALKLYLGASPAGPAGTGKTETVKDLAKNLARQCIVYNCSDGITFKMMEKFFSGLIQTGAWACLDEFNRINIEVLSVIASQLLEIKLALQGKMSHFNFQGTPDVRVRATYGAFITMNPGYAGRTELPDNLKILFRPVACMTPDFRMIAEVILYSEGFTNAKDLSLKITQLYKLSSEQLSPQDHYDFGMRALKSILVMAGDLKRSQPDVSEDLTLIVACNDSNVPKFVAEDILLFQGIMQDLFPGVSFPAREYVELLPAMHAAMEEKKLLDMGSWVKKGIQLYETLIVRHGVMLVGVTGTGKSESRNCIASALVRMHAAGSTNPMAQPVHQFILNPKAVLLHELYGQLDVNTNEWKDGVLAVIAKSCVRAAEGNPEHRWIVFDGPVDTLWIESLNSVLDDSKLLCLDSGERIKLPDAIHMLFEVADLAVASPATVSRCGMVYVDAADLPWQAIVGQWAETKLARAGAEPQCRAYVVSLFHTYVEKGLAWLRQQKSLISAGEINTIQSMCDLFTAMAEANKVQFMKDPTGETVLPPDDNLFKERNEMCHVLFAFSFIWAIGGNVGQTSMDSFDPMVRDVLESVVRFPNHGSVYDFTIDFTSRMMIPWASLVPEYSYDPAVPFFNILVPTVDTVRYDTLARTLLQYGKPLLFSGQSGVGKSVMLADCLHRHQETLRLAIVSFQFSAQTSSERTQGLLESKLRQKRRDVLGAPPGRSVALFIDDLNMPALEVFGASPPIELLRQLMGAGGFYDRKDAGCWKTVEDVTVVAACGPPEGGRNPVTARLTRLFHLFQIPNQTDASMTAIFHSILQGFLDQHNFAKEVREMARTVVLASVDVFNRLCQDLRPRPSTPHYTFNLRDLAKVFQGMTQVVPRVCRDKASMARLWLHECMRCFYDRLASAEDRRFFTEELMMDAVGRVFPGSPSHADLFEGAPVVWGDFLRFGAVEPIYEEASDFTRIPIVLDEYQDDYNASLSAAKPSDDNAVQASPLNLVFFQDHCAHLARIIRIVRQPRGNALLVGVGGSGKRSLTRLAAFIAGCRVFEISVGKGYSMTEFHEFLLEVYTAAGVHCQPSIFLLSDNQIVDESMLEDVNNILNSGEVPSLFTPEEREKRVSACLEAAQQKGITNRDDVYNFFISRVRDNMHTVLCMSPVGETFRTRCRQFPSLTNCCSVDWFDEWPQEALASVAGRLLEDMKEVIPDDLYGKLPALCVEVHSTITEIAAQYWEELRRRFYVTPTSYLEFIEMYKGVLTQRRTILSEQLAQVVNGKQKMEETDATIAKMKVEIEQKRPQLEKASEETEAVVADLTVRQAKAGEVQVQVRAQQQSAAQQQQVASKIAAEANGRLAEAKPIIDRAKAALDTIQASDLNELRSFANPPSAVLKTAQACMTMFDYKDFGGSWSGSTDWKGAREFLSHRPLLDMIRGYPTDNVKPAILQRIQKYINDDEFTVEVCSTRGSQTCGSLCAWVHAVNEYSKVVKEVAPMREAAASAEANLKETNEKLRAAQDQLRQVEEELATLQEHYETSLKKKNDLEAGLKICISRLENAETLSGSLKSEGVRWTENIKGFNERLSKLPLQAFLASACAVYFGVFTPNFRVRVQEAWAARLAHHDLDVKGVTLSDIMGNPVDTLNWQVHGLPTDETSTENAIIAAMSYAPRRWPLFIDPQEQGIKWLTRQYSGVLPAENGRTPQSLLRVIKLSDPTWLRTLEKQIRLGGVVVIDDVGESLDPALEPLISRRITTADGGGPQIQLTPQSGPIDYHPNFRLFMCTKLPNPHYLPDISTRVALLNFTVTLEGLEAQMLGEVVSIEKQEMEREKNEIIQSIAKGQATLQRLEETILERLQSTRGNILDDSDLIAELKSAQSNAAALSVSQAEAAKKMEVISGARERYRDMAVRAAVLFFVVADVARIDPMYQYSLQFFVALARQVIASAVKPEGYVDEDEEHFQAHLLRVKNSLTETTYTQLCRGLFNKDKIILSLLIGTAIARQQGTIREDEWQYFIRAPALVASHLPDRPPGLEWMTRVQWELAEALGRTVAALREWPESLRARADEWQTFASSDAPQSAALPGDWGERLGPFHRVLLVRCLREEKLFFALAAYVEAAMGTFFTDPPPFRLSSTLQDSAPATPIIFVLSQGADPMEALQAFAKAEGQELRYVSLGQGQGENAKRLIASCRRAGSWALLQNCHLSKSFMPELEAQVAELQQPQAATHPNFRLWLTSMPTDFFPIFVLQTSLKVTNEPPTGLRANMARCFHDLTDDDYCTFSPSAAATAAGEPVTLMGGLPKGLAYKKLLYGLCFFHSVVLERKKFGPLGWNVRYEWNDTDFHVSKEWLRLFFEEQEDIPWESLEYIIGQINYGGRVTDPQDRGTLQTILRSYLCPDILADGYCYSGRYPLPGDGTLDEVRASITAMPTVDDPEVFGLHENANLRYQLQTSQYLLATIVSIQPRMISAAAGGGLTPEEEVMKKCEEFEATLPPNISREDAGPRTFTTLANGLPNSMSTVLSHELVRYNTLLTRMRQTLADMQKALQGLTVLSADLDAMFRSFLSDQVPQLWSAVAYASLKPLGAWYREFLERVRFIQTWVQRGEPHAYWIAGFFNPSSFMTGVYQAFARAEGISVDRLGFSYQVIETDVAMLTEGPERGCYVYGVFSDAWRWDGERRVMADSLPGEQYTQLPVIHFLPEPYHKRPPTSHAVPLYRTTVRAGVISSLGASSNYVLSIEFPTAESSEYWLLKGAACVCALDQ